MKFAIVPFNFRSLFLVLLFLNFSIWLFNYLCYDWRGRGRVGNYLWLFYLSKCTRKKKKRLCKEIKASRSEFQEKKLRWHVCLPTPGILQHVVFTELAVYSSSPVVRERFVSLEVRESLTSQQNYRYGQGTLIHVWMCAYINITRLLEFIFPQYSLSSSAWNI